MEKEFCITRLLQFRNSKTELREREPHFTDGKIEAKKKKERERNKGKGLKSIQTPENNIYNAVMQLRNNY